MNIKSYSGAEASVQNEKDFKKSLLKSQQAAKLGHPRKHSSWETLHPSSR